jgi:hypothetical protein
MDQPVEVEPVLPLELPSLEPLELPTSIGTHSPISLWCEPCWHMSPSGHGHTCVQPPSGIGVQYGGSRKSGCVQPCPRGHW